MIERRVRDRLSQILEAAAAIERLTAGRSLDDYVADSDRVASVERYIERLSEASRYIPKALKREHPTVDWRGLVDVGNALRYAYDERVDGQVWRVASLALAPLVSAVKDMLGESVKSGHDQDTNGTVA